MQSEDKTMEIKKINITDQMHISSSWIIYVCKDAEIAEDVRRMCENMKPVAGTKEAYCHVMSCKIYSACMVPEFFHNRGYYMVGVEHNRGDWDLEPTYDLYLAY